MEEMEQNKGDNADDLTKMNKNQTLEYAEDCLMWKQLWMVTELNPTDRGQQRGIWISVELFPMLQD